MQYFSPLPASPPSTPVCSVAVRGVLPLSAWNHLRGGWDRRCRHMPTRHIPVNAGRGWHSLRSMSPGDVVQELGAQVNEWLLPVDGYTRSPLTHPAIGSADGGQKVRFSLYFSVISAKAAPNSEYVDHARNLNPSEIYKGLLHDHRSRSGICVSNWARRTLPKH